MKAVTKPMPVRASHVSSSSHSVFQPYFNLINSLADTLKQVGTAVFTTIAEGSIVLPIAMLVVLNYDFGYALWFVIPVMAGAVATLIVNLTLAPVKTILHVFFANVAFLILIVLIHLL